MSMKFDEGKLQWSLLPWTEVEEVVKVLQYGAEKYGPDNWQTLDNFEQRYSDAAMRHLTAYLKGFALDPESARPHLAHAACNILFLLWKENNK